MEKSEYEFRLSMQPCKINEIKKFPRNISNNHESCYQSYQLLQKVLHLLQQNTPHSVILEIIEECLSECGEKQ
jgi:EAL domain-containing protein (putative c-di-GMP-specific phosphodiesterase class I)